MSALPRLSIEAGSAQAILSAPCQILVDEALASALGSLDPGVQVTVFDAAGILRDPASRERSGDPLEIAAVPHDVLLIAATAAGESAAASLAAVFDAADARPRPVRVVVKADANDGPALRGELSTHLLPILARRLRQAEALLADREGELVELRRLTEWQALGLRRGREIVEAIGFDTRVLAYELGPGSRTIRPSDHSLPAIVQRLPVDLSGIASIALHLAEGAAGEGRMTIGLSRPGGTVADAQLAVEYGDLAPGWNEFRLAQAVGPGHGDALLTLGFMGASGEAAPVLSLAEADVADFGLEAPAIGASLAFRVWKGLSSQDFAGTPPARTVVRGNRIEPPALRSSLGFWQGAAAEAVLRRKSRLGPLASVDADGRLRTRTLGDQPVGALLKAVLPADTRTVRVAVSPVNGAEGAVLAGLYVPEPGAGSEPDDLRATVERALAAVADGGAAPVPGIAVKRLSASRAATIELPIEAAGGARDLVFFVGETSQAGLEVVANGIEFDVERRPAGDRLPPSARRIPLPELKSRVSYVFGDGEGARVSGMLGFPALEVSDVENFMQTHPVLDGISGARVKGVLPSGLCRVGATVATAHPQGPVIEYALLVVRADAGDDDPQDFAETLSAFLDGTEAGRPDFVIAAAQKVTDAGHGGRIDLELDAPLVEPADLLCLVRSLSGHISFAWCRWFALEVEVASPKLAVHEAVAPAEAPRRRLFRWR